MSDTVRIRLGDIDMIPDLSGALYVPDMRSLLVADLHLEKASSIARRGLHLPPYDTRTSLALLERVIAGSGAERIIFLGDSFHDDDAVNRIDDADLKQLQAITARLDTTWITGNHDPNPPASAGGRIVSEVRIGDVLLRHEPSALVDGVHEIAGHLHPAAVVSQRGRRIRCKCFIGNGQRVVMPAFGSFTGSLSISAPPFVPLFHGGDFEVWMLGGKAVYRLPGRRVM